MMSAFALTLLLLPFASISENANTKTSGYQQYYKQYMKGGSSQSESGKSSQGGYQQYYQQYIGGGGKASKSGTGGYQQYYQQYLGGGASKSGQGGYQQYYQQYVGGGGQGSSSKASSGGYQQYYQQYMGGGAKDASSKSGASSKSSAGGYQQYYQQYMGGSGSKDSNKGNGGYQQYYQQYLGGNGGTQDASSKSSSSKSDSDKYYQQYKQVADDSKNKSSHAKDMLFASGEFLSAMPPMILAEVAACSTTQCVEDWHTKHVAEIKKYVPKDYQHFALASIQKEYKKNLARIAAKSNRTHTGKTDKSDKTDIDTEPTTTQQQNSFPWPIAVELSAVPPVVLAQVSACTTKRCVEDWRNSTETDIRKYVPKDYQHFAVESIEKEYKKNLARVAQANASNSTKSAGTFLAATNLNSQSSRSRALMFLAVVSLSLVAGFFVSRSFAGQKRISVEDDVLRYQAMLAA